MRGRTAEFDPAAPHLALNLPTQRPGQPLSWHSVNIGRDRIAYVAFHRESLPAAPPPVPGTLSDHELHLADGTTLTVQAAPEDLAEPLGFYGVPGPGQGTVAEVFIYGHAIKTRENKQPLGSLMVDKKLLSPEQLSEGLEHQAAAANAPLGQILVEQQKVTSKQLEAAVEQQREQLRRGRPLRIGEILVDAGLATDADVGAALAEQKKRRGKRLGEVLIEMGIVSEKDVARTLAEKFDLPFADLEETSVDSDAIHQIPLGLIEKYQVFPFRADNQSIHIAMSDPLAMEALDMLRFSLSKRIIEVMVPPSQLQSRLEMLLGRDTSGDSLGNVDDILQELNVDADEFDVSNDSENVTVARADDSAAAKLVNRIIFDAIQREVSDIHVEPNGPEHPTVIRFRVDGLCHVYRRLPATLRAQLVARIKIMANLDIAEKRRPQDGKIRFALGKRRVELRVATLPTVMADEDVVMRILAGAGAMPLEEMGLNQRNYDEAVGMTKQPYGLILVVGPTGSGKTTTLHAMLGIINTPERKIWTAEDPVEIVQPGLRQVQMHPKINVTFATAMRAFLRADPDVIMVGEMRDLETASTGVEASLTGHLVLSTLHTNSAPETVVRLIDMGLDPFSFADALLGVLAQRLARRLCSHCKESYEATREEQEELITLLGSDRLAAMTGPGPLTLWRAPGCTNCRDGGYRGRVALHELLVNDDELRQAIQRRAPAKDLRDMACARGMTTLLHDGIAKCLDGQTDLKQVLAVCSR
jgi:type II secretory ATPase GspE/PulE/Tfp pilus assembly ATPase PilB-like protein